MATIYISFSAPINSFTAQNLLAHTFDQIGKGATHIYYLFSTPGGSVSDGMNLYNVLKGLPIKTTMHNVGNVDSIGNAVFLAGQRRKACAHSTFMFHGVGFDINGHGRFEEKDLRERLGGLLADQKRIGDVISNETTLQGRKVRDLFRQAATKDATHALNSGIVHSVEDIVIPTGAPVLQLVFDR